MTYKSILVTGGAGFQGSHLTEALVKKGQSVTVLNTFSERSEKNLENVKGKVNLVWGSITDKEVVEKTVRGHDVVFHLASHINVDDSITDPVSTVTVNVAGSMNVFEAVRKNGNRLIHVSTWEVYGATENGEPISETRELKPQSPYAASKAAVDRILYSYFMTFDLNAVIIRPFNVFGPRQKSGKGGALIPTLIDKALHKEPITIFGDGKQTRDYIYIDDLIKAYLMVFEDETLKGEVINFGTAKETSVFDIANHIAKSLNTRIEFAPGRPGEVAGFIADISKASKMGFKPEVDIFAGIDRCIKWQKEMYVRQ